MISLIICSKDANSIEKLNANIADTIGTPFEIIVIDNQDGMYSLCSAYNKGGDEAQYDYLCFLHEDIEFVTADWGWNVIRHLSEINVGLIGIAGGDTKSLVPSSWSSFIFPSEINIIQHYRKSNKEGERICRTGYPDDSSFFHPVASIDGVFMCTRKNVFKEFRFDEKVFDGFHGYDIDYSLQVGSKYKVGTVTDILIHHFSEGSFNSEWLKYATRLSNKWKSHLPVSARSLSKKIFVHQHWTAMRVYLWKQIELDYSLYTIFKNLIQFSVNRHFHLLNFLHFTKTILLVKIFRSEKAMKKLTPSP